MLNDLRPHFLSIFEKEQEDKKKKRVSDNEIAFRIIQKVYEEYKRRHLIS